MESKVIPAIFESGKLRPLEPLDLNEQERVGVVIVRATEAGTQSEDDYLPAIAAEADSTVTLEQVQQALAKLPGSLAEDFARERDIRLTPAEQKRFAEALLKPPPVAEALRDMARNRESLLDFPR